MPMRTLWYKCSTFRFVENLSLILVTLEKTLSSYTLVRGIVKIIFTILAKSPKLSGF